MFILKFIINQFKNNFTTPLIQTVFQRISGPFISTSIDENNFQNFNHLKNLKLNSNNINQKFLKSAPYVIRDGIIGDFIIKIPSFSQLLTESIMVEVKNIEINLIFNRNLNFKDFSSNNSHQILDLNQNEKQNQIEDEVDQENIDNIRKLVDKLIKNMSVHVENVVIKVHFSQNQNSPILFIRIDNIQCNQHNNDQDEDNKWQNIYLTIERVNAHLLPFGEKHINQNKYSNQEVLNSEYPFTYPTINTPTSILVLGFPNQNQSNQLKFIFKKHKLIKNNFQIELIMPMLEIILEPNQIYLLNKLLIIQITEWKERINDFVLVQTAIDFDQKEQDNQSLVANGEGFISAVHEVKQMINEDDSNNQAEKDQNTPQQQFDIFKSLYYKNTSKKDHLQQQQKTKFLNNQNLLTNIIKDFYIENKQQIMNPDNELEQQENKEQIEMIQEQLKDQNNQEMKNEKSMQKVNIDFEGIFLVLKKQDELYNFQKNYERKWVSQHFDKLPKFNQFLPSGQIVLLISKFQFLQQKMKKFEIEIKSLKVNDVKLINNKNFSQESKNSQFGKSQYFDANESFTVQDMQQKKINLVLDNWNFNSEQNHFCLREIISFKKSANKPNKNSCNGINELCIHHKLFKDDKSYNQQIYHQSALNKNNFKSCIYISKNTNKVNLQASKNQNKINYIFEVQTTPLIINFDFSLMLSLLKMAHPIAFLSSNLISSKEKYQFQMQPDEQIQNDENNLELFQSCNLQDSMMFKSCVSFGLMLDKKKSKQLLNILEQEEDGDSDLFEEDESYIYQKHRKNSIFNSQNALDTKKLNNFLIKVNVPYIRIIYSLLNMLYIDEFIDETLQQQNLLQSNYLISSHLCFCANIYKIYQNSNINMNQLFQNQCFIQDFSFIDIKYESNNEGLTKIIQIDLDDISLFTTSMDQNPLQLQKILQISNAKQKIKINFQKIQKFNENQTLLNMSLPQLFCFLNQNLIITNVQALKDELLIKQQYFSLIKGLGKQLQEIEQQIKFIYQKKEKLNQNQIQEEIDINQNSKLQLNLKIENFGLYLKLNNNEENQYDSIVIIKHNTILNNVEENKNIRVSFNIQDHNQIYFAESFLLQLIKIEIMYNKSQADHNIQLNIHDAFLRDCNIFNFCSSEGIQQDLKNIINVRNSNIQSGASFDQKKLIRNNKVLNENQLQIVFYKQVVFNNKQLIIQNNSLIKCQFCFSLNKQEYHDLQIQINGLVIKQHFQFQSVKQIQFFLQQLMPSKVQQEQENSQQQNSANKNFKIQTTILIENTIIDLFPIIKQNNNYYNFQNTRSLIMLDQIIIHMEPNQVVRLTYFKMQFYLLSISDQNFNSILLIDNQYKLNMPNSQNIIQKLGFQRMLDLQIKESSIKNLNKVDFIIEELNIYGCSNSLLNIIKQHINQINDIIRQQFLKREHNEFVEIQIGQQQQKIKDEEKELTQQFQNVSQMDSNAITISDDNEYQNELKQKEKVEKFLIQNFDEKFWNMSQKENNEEIKYEIKFLIEQININLFKGKDFDFEPTQNFINIPKSEQTIIKQQYDINDSSSSDELSESQKKQVKLVSFQRYLKFDSMRDNKDFIQIQIQWLQFNCIFYKKNEIIIDDINQLYDFKCRVLDSKFSIKELIIFDKLKNSEGNKVLFKSPRYDFIKEQENRGCNDDEEIQNYQESNFLSLQINLTQNQNNQYTLCLFCILHPIRINLNQENSNFFFNFFPQQKGKIEQQQKKVNESKIFIELFFFKKTFFIIDYDPSRVSLIKIIQDKKELRNIGYLTDVIIYLPQIENYNEECNEMMNWTINWWLNDLKANQKFVLISRLPFISNVVNLLEGAANFFYLPYKTMKGGKGIEKGITKGVKKLFTVFGKEAINVAEATNNFISSGLSYVGLSSLSNNFFLKKIIKTTKNMVISLNYIWSQLQLDN